MQRPFAIYMTMVEMSLGITILFTLPKTLFPMPDLPYEASLRSHVVEGHVYRNRFPSAYQVVASYACVEYGCGR